MDVRAAFNAIVGNLEYPMFIVTARAGDDRHLAGQRALSEALFGGFARVVDALRRDDRARSASPGGR